MADFVLLILSVKLFGEMLPVEEALREVYSSDDVRLSFIRYLRALKLLTRAAIKMHNSFEK